MSTRKKRTWWVYVVISADPDAEIDSIWEDESDAKDQCADMHTLWPGMGYYVQSVQLNKAKVIA